MGETPSLLEGSRGVLLRQLMLTTDVSGVVGGFQDAVHITAILGESVVFNCQVEFPADHPVPYVLQWEKKVGDTVGYLTHTHSPSLSD